MNMTQNPGNVIQTNNMYIPYMGLYACLQLYTMFSLQLFQTCQKRLSWSVVDAGTERNLGYSHNE